MSLIGLNEVSSGTLDAFRVNVTGVNGLQIILVVSGETQLYNCPNIACRYRGVIFENFNKNIGEQITIKLSQNGGAVFIFESVTVEIGD